MVRLNHASIKLWDSSSLGKCTMERSFVVAEVLKDCRKDEIVTIIVKIARK